VSYVLDFETPEEAYSDYCWTCLENGVEPISFESFVAFVDKLNSEIKK
jgi:hypothetical protein